MNEIVWIFSLPAIRKSGVLHVPGLADRCYENIAGLLFGSVRVQRLELFELCHRGAHRSGQVSIAFHPLSHSLSSITTIRVPSDW